MIEFRHVYKRYANRVIGLENASFHIRPGEFVFLVGPSGAGKSSLVKLLMKHITPDRGEIYFAGRNITRLSARHVPRLRQRIGVVFQEFRLLEDMTVYENIEYCLNLLGLSRRQKKARIRDVLQLVHLTGRERSYPNQLSGGEQQRVAIARAMASRPTVLVADEPTGNLDPQTSWEIMNSFAEINQKGTTVIVSTHDQAIVDAMKKRVIQLSHGKIVRDQEHGMYLDARTPMEEFDEEVDRLFDPTVSFPADEIRRRIAEAEQEARAREEAHAAESAEPLLGKEDGE